MIAGNSALVRVPAAALLLVAVGLFVVAGVCADIALEYHRLAKLMMASFDGGASAGQPLAELWSEFNGALYQTRRQGALEFSSYAVAAAVAGLVFFPWRVFRG